MKTLWGFSETRGEQSEPAVASGMAVRWKGVGDFLHLPHAFWRYTIHSISSFNSILRYSTFTSPLRFVHERCKKSLARGSIPSGFRPPDAFRNVDDPEALLYWHCAAQFGLAVGDHDCSGRNLATVPEPPTL